MIKYLEENEKSLTKSLYKEAFFEDSQSFVGYYYDEKLKDNRILADIEGREIRSMLMLNPYNISVFDRKYKLNYIVAVATEERFKRQGFMRKLLNKALIDMNTLNIPFTYLIPANKDYYIPFDFAFVANKNEYNIDLSQTEYEKITLKELTYEEAQEIISFINEEVSQNNDVYTCRDIKYFKREIKEIASAPHQLRTVGHAGLPEGPRIPVRVRALLPEEPHRRPRRRRRRGAGRRQAQRRRQPRPRRRQPHGAGHPPGAGQHHQQLPDRGPGVEAARRRRRGHPPGRQPVGSQS